jgi:predicted ATP-grasp superfamily ATP-dependent carboligase
MALIPIVGPSYNLNSKPADVQRTVNMVPRLIEPGTERERWAFKDVPGLTAFGSSGLFFILMESGGYILNEANGRIQLEV